MRSEIINAPFCCKQIQLAMETLSHRHHWGRKISFEKEQVNLRLETAISKYDREHVWFISQQKLQLKETIAKTY